MNKKRSAILALLLSFLASPVAAGPIDISARDLCEAPGSVLFGQESPGSVLTPSCVGTAVGAFALLPAGLATGAVAGAAAHPFGKSGDVFEYAAGIPFVGGAFVGAAVTGTPFWLAHEIASRFR